MTATTLSTPTTTHDSRGLWTRLAMFAGGALLGITATAVIANDNDSPASTTVSTDASFRSASAAEADSYVTGLESRAVSPSAADVHVSADAAEHWASASDTNPYLLPGAYAHGFSYGSNMQPGDCGRVVNTIC